MNITKSKSDGKRRGYKPPGIYLILIPLLAAIVVSLAACTNNDEKVANESKIARTENNDASPLKGLNAAGKNALYSIDIINGQPVPKESSVIINTQEITMGGWAVDQQSQSPAGGVYITVDGKQDVSTVYGSERKDVADVQKNSRYRNSGFAASILTSTLEKGHHTLGLKILTADKKGYYEPDQKIDITVK